MLEHKRRVFFHSVCEYCGSDMFEYEEMATRRCGCVRSEAIYCLECGELLGIAESDSCDCRQFDDEIDAE